MTPGGQTLALLLSRARHAAVWRNADLPGADSRARRGVGAGCHSLRPCSLHLPASSSPLEASPLLAARAATQRGNALQASGQDACVEAYFSACAFSWRAIADDTSDSLMSATSAYNKALEQLVASAQQFGRLNPSHGLTLYADGQTTTVPIVHQGFAWRPADFECLRPAPHGHDKLLMRRYECPGAGMPLVVERSRQDADSVEARFYPEKSYFAATAVLRFSSGEGTPGALKIRTRPHPEFYNPLARRSSRLPGRRCLWPRTFPHPSQ